MPAAPKANPPIRILLGPGPSPVHPRVLEALSLPVIGHLDPKFLEIMEQFLEFAVPAYIAEGKSRLTIAIGCTGGFHRSIVMAEELAAWLREKDFGPVAVFHRELERT